MSYQKVHVLISKGHNVVLNRNVVISERILLRRLFSAMEFVTRKLNNIISLLLIIFGLGIAILELFISLSPLVICIRLMSTLIIFTGLLSLYYNEKSRFSIVTLMESFTYAIMGLISAVISSWLVDPYLNEAITTRLSDFLRGTLVRRYIAKGIIILTLREIFLPLNTFSFAFLMFGLLLFINRVTRYHRILPMTSSLNDLINYSCKVHSKREAEEFRALLEPFHIAIDLFISSTRSRCILQLWSSLDGILKAKYRELFQREPVDKRGRYYSPIQIVEKIANRNPLKDVDEHSKGILFRELNEAWNVRNKVIHEGYMPKISEVTRTFLVGVVLIAIVLNLSFRLETTE